MPALNDSRRRSRQRCAGLAPSVLSLALAARTAVLIAGGVLHSTIALAADVEMSQAHFRVGAVSAAPGTRASGDLHVPAPDGEEAIALPVTVINGAHDGPTLALIAGTHGSEYAPMIALQRVRKSLDPSAVSGRLILVHVANTPSFFARTIYCGPDDGKNLNRLYYGDPAGTISERIAHTITTEVIENADYLIDMHAGDGNESLAPYIYLPVTGATAIDQVMRRMALAFGIEHILLTPLADADPAAPGYTETAAVLRGVPAITTETGRRGETDERWVRLAERGVYRVAVALGMLEGDAPDPGRITWLTDPAVLSASADGMFRALAEPGDSVRAGDVLGELTDLYGDPIETVRAPFDGWINYIITTPPVSRGEPLLQISRVAN
jgi:predicted deacylase